MQDGYIIMTKASRPERKLPPDERKNNYLKHTNLFIHESLHLNLQQDVKQLECRVWL